MSAHTPPVKWAQRKDSLFLTIDIPDVKDPTIELSATHLVFKCVRGRERSSIARECTCVVLVAQWRCQFVPSCGCVSPRRLCSHMCSCAPCLCTLTRHAGPCFPTSGARARSRRLSSTSSSSSLWTRRTRCVHAGRRRVASCAQCASARALVARVPHACRLPRRCDACACAEPPSRCVCQRLTLCACAYVGTGLQVHRAAA